MRRARNHQTRRKSAYLHIHHSRASSSEIKTHAKQNASNNEGKVATVHQGTHVVDASKHILSRLLERIQKSKGERTGTRSSQEKLEHDLLVRSSPDSYKATHDHLVTNNARINNATLVHNEPENQAGYTTDHISCRRIGVHKSFQIKKSTN